MSKYNSYTTVVLYKTYIDVSLFCIYLKIAKLWNFYVSDRRRKQMAEATE